MWCCQRAAAAAAAARGAVISAATCGTFAALGHNPKLLLLHRCMWHCCHTVTVMRGTATVVLCVVPSLCCCTNSSCCCCCCAAACLCHCQCAAACGTVGTLLCGTVAMPLCKQHCSGVVAVFAWTPGRLCGDSQCRTTQHAPRTFSKRKFSAKTEIGGNRKYFAKTETSDLLYVRVSVPARTLKGRSSHCTR